MSAYVIVRVNILDRDRYLDYMKHTPRTIAKFGGRFIARGGSPETLEGPTESLRMVVLEFPSADIARDWYHSADYQAAKALRDGAGEGQFVLIDGFSDEAWTSAVAASNQLSL